MKELEELDGVITVGTALVEDSATNEFVENSASGVTKVEEDGNAGP